MGTNKHKNLNFPIKIACLGPYLPKVTTKVYGTNNENCLFTKTLKAHTEFAPTNHV